MDVFFAYPVNQPADGFVRGMGVDLEHVMPDQQGYLVLDSLAVGQPLQYRFGQLSTYLIVAVEVNSFSIFTHCLRFAHIMQ